MKRLKLPSFSLRIFQIEPLFAAIRASICAILPLFKSYPELIKGSFKKNVQSAFFGMIISAVVSFSLISALRYSGILQPLELSAYDIHMQFRNEKRIENSPVVLIRIYEKDIQELRQYPISDQVLAIVLEELSQMGASVIGIDIFRDLPTAGRERFKNIVNANTRIVVVDKILGSNHIKAPDFISDQKQIGFADLKQDSDGVIRRGILMIWNDDNTVRFSFPLQLVLAYLKESSISLTADPEDENNVRLNDVTLKRFAQNDGGYRRADDGGYQFLMNYDRGSIPYTSYSFTDVLNDKISADKIKNKLIIIGVTADSVQDQHETPFSHYLSSDKPMYGVEIHAQLTEQLLLAALENKQQIQVLNELKEISWIVIFALIGAISGMIVKRASSLFIVSLICLTLLFLEAQYLFSLKLWVPMVPWVLSFLTALIISSAIVMQREAFSHQLIRNMFGKFVSPEIADHLWQQRDQFIKGNRLKQQELIASVLMADIEDSTSIMEQMSPNEALEWNNTCMSMVTEVAMRYGGLVDDYAGDGIKINFGVPVPSLTKSEIQRDAIQAIDCALEIEAKLFNVNNIVKQKNWPRIRLRIGISTGLVVAGSQGNLEHMKYTTMGDTVNRAARFESFDKESFSKETDKMCRIIVGQTTIEHVGDKYKTLLLGNQKIAGIEKKIALYRIVKK